MTSVYPGGLDALATAIQDDTDSKSGADLGLSTTVGHHAQHHIDLADAVNKIEAELGINPSGSLTDVATRLNSTTTVRKTADQTFSSNASLANVTDLVFPVIIGADYSFEFFIPFTAAALTTGIALAITVPAASYFAASVRMPRGTETAAGAAPAIGGVEYVNWLTASAEIAVSDSTPAITPAVFVAKIEGVLSNPSAGGNIQVQARTEVNASNIVIKKGASGVMWTN